jgi:inner membrane protein
MGINILQDYRLLPVIFIASLLPDIDHTKSIIGKAFYPIAKAINRKYGHRTITHSLIVWLALVALVSAFQAAYFPSIKVAQVFALAYGSHLIFDMMTIQGVPLFYPFKKNPCVLPGNPEMRLRTSSVRHETVVFCFFLVSAVFLKPLFANGFWTSYNSLFGKLKHIVSEYNKSKDLMIVDFTLRYGSETKKIRGLCIAVSSSKVTIITKKKRFESYPKEGQLLADIYPTHTRMNYSFEQGQFHNLTVDSLHSLFRKGKYTKLEIHGSTSFIHKEQGVDKTASTIVLDYPNELILREIVNNKTIDYISNPAIETKQKEINMYRTIQKQKEQDYRTELNQYHYVKKQIEDETDLIKKELIMIEFNKMKAPTPPDPIEQKINTLQAQIRELHKEDQQKHEKAAKDAQTQPLSFSGSFEKLLINGKNIL